jgi:hypothetical protein
MRLINSVPFSRANSRISNKYGESVGSHHCNEISRKPFIFSLSFSIFIGIFGYPEQNGQSWLHISTILKVELFLFSMYPIFESKKISFS